MGRSPLDHWLVGRMGSDSLPGPGELRRWQLERIRLCLAHAVAESPFYARHLEDHDLSCPSFEAFADLPCMTSDDLRDAPERLLCVSQDEVARVVTLNSSGTTGRPKRIFHTAEDLEATVEYFRWGMANMVEPGQTVFVLMPDERPGGVARLLSEALSRIGARTVAHGVLDDADAALAQCLEERASCVVGSPAHVNLLAGALRRRAQSDHEIYSVLLCWDAIPDAVVSNVAEAFGCRVFRHWGMIETGLGGAVECAPGAGMHLRETDVFVEIVDPDSGRVCPDGVFGELVVTTPLRRGMPLIRYRTGDMGRILPGPCGCGSPLRRLDANVWRRGEGIETPCGHLALRELAECLYAVPGVGDFSASFDDGILRILLSAQGDGVADAARDALQSIPAVARDGMHLTVELETTSASRPAVPGLAKRGIIMER